MLNRFRGASLALALALALGAPGAGASDTATPFPFSADHHAGERYMGVRLLGVLKLAPATVDGIAVSGLSGLAWDEDEDTLYALSDNGAVFHLAVDFDTEGLLGDARVLHAFALKDHEGKAFTGRRADSEGLVALNTRNGIRGDTELVVSFERVHRVLRFSPTGALRGTVALPARLREPGRYRSGNRALESLAWHPALGLLAAPELPFNAVTDGTVELHALDTGRFWAYPLAPEPNAGLTDLHVLDDGTLLALERGYGVFFIPFITTLRRVRRFPAEDGAPLEVETLARFNTGQGWSLDNFEGLTQQRGRRILMVSDDNGRPYQNTLLAAFELADPKDSSPPAANHESGQGTVPER